MTVDTDLERLRLTIGDTDVTDAALFKDAELNWFLSVESNNILNAALRACYAAQAKFARGYDFWVDGQRFDRSQMAKAYADLAKRLEAQGATLTGGAAGLQSVATTKVDGYSEDIPADQTSVGGTATSNPRQRFVVIGGYDQIP